MHPDGAASGNSDVPPGLPPVEPPSGRFLAQLFLIPLLIVAVLVLLALAGLWWAKGRYGQDEAATTEHFVEELSSSNPDVWWRGAHELAQILKRPESLALASYPKFSLDLGDKLRQELAGLEREERLTYEQTKGLPAEERKAAFQKLATQRDQVRFLISALGDFTVPTGVPLLSEIALAPDGPDVKASTLRRRLAVWALANLGENLKRWPKLSAPQRERAVADLRKEAAGRGPRADAARLAYEHLTKGRPLGVDATLAECAVSQDVHLRTLAAMALNFWDGPLVEPTLERLSYDDGHGTRLDISDND
jgi:hypothetical protein